MEPQELVRLFQKEFTHTEPPYKYTFGGLDAAAWRELHMQWADECKRPAARRAQWISEILDSIREYDF